MNKADNETQTDDSSRSKPARVSAIVISYFTGPLLSRSIEALRRQPDISDIILVDNGNWPKAVEEALADKGVLDDAVGAPPVVVLSGHGNIGFAAACNLGAGAAKSEFLLFINPDALMPPGGVARLLADAPETDAHWMIAPKLVGPDGLEQQGSRREVLTPWRAFIEATQLYRLAPNHPYFRRFNTHNDPCPEKVTEQPVVSGACFLLPRAAYDHIGGMDERYFLHVEDIDFCLRFTKAGGRIYFSPHVSVTHYKSSSRVNQVRVSARKTSSMNRYFRTHFNKVYPPGFLWIVAILIWGVHFARAAVIVARKGIARVRALFRLGPEGVRRAAQIARKRTSR
jgi:GT2 family glycosyltransferase